MDDGDKVVRSANPQATSKPVLRHGTTTTCYRNHWFYGGDGTAAGDVEPAASQPITKPTRVARQSGKTIGRRKYNASSLNPGSRSSRATPGWCQVFDDKRAKKHRFPRNRCLMHKQIRLFSGVWALSSDLHGSSLLLCSTFSIGGIRRPGYWERRLPARALGPV